MSDEATRCRVCRGRGYFHCDCWPADCICGYDYEPCDECEGTGWLRPDHFDYLDGEYPELSAMALAKMIVAKVKSSPAWAQPATRKTAVTKPDKRAKVKAARAQNVKRRRK